MRKVPLPVIVVTCNNGSESRGMTCASFNSISLDPPIISFAIKLPSKTRDILQQCSSYAVHLLSSDQIHQSIRFSSPKTQHQFDSFPFYLKDKIPILQGCMSVLECVPYKSHVIGDHEIWYSKVLDIIPDGIKKQGQKYEPLKPLLYYESSYRSIGDEVFIQAFETSQLDFQEWTHRAHVRMAWIYLQNSDRRVAHEKIRMGIQQYNKSNAHLIKHGYNETITSFFCLLVQLAIDNDNSNLDFLDFLERYPYLDQFGFIFNYYSREVLYSKEATEK